LRPGELVRVSSSRASLVLEATQDDDLPRGTAAIDFNQGGAEGAADLVDATNQVTDVRLENAKRDPVRTAARSKRADNG
jgi:hypothetical protein